MIRWITTGMCMLAMAGSGVAKAQDSVALDSVALETLLEHAEQHSPVMRVARARADRWRVDDAADVPLPADPTVQLGLGPRFEGDASAVDVQVQLRQRLEIAGESGLRGEVRDRARDRWQSQLEAARFELHHAVHATYHRALITRERVRVAERMLAFWQRLEETSETRVQLGEDLPLSRSQTRLARMRAEQTLTHEQHGDLDARLSLAELTGWPSDPPPAPRGELERPRRSPDVAELVRLAEEHGPQLAVLRAAGHEARARAALEARDGWPEPTVGLNYQLESAPGGGLPEHQILGVLSVPIPLFHRNPVGRAEAETRQEVARAEEQAATDSLEVRLRRLAATVDATADQLVRYREALLPEARAQLEQLEQARALGEINTVEAGAGQELVLSTELEALAAYQEYYDALAALADAVGVDPWPDVHHDEARGGAR